jgi:hypothetical protein
MPQGRFKRAKFTAVPCYDPVTRRSKKRNRRDNDDY